MERMIIAPPNSNLANNKIENILISKKIKYVKFGETVI
jgi:hypothetical protein